MAFATLVQTWLRKTLREAVEGFERIVVVFEPWADPEPFKRSWCLWQVCTPGRPASLLLRPLSLLPQADALAGLDFI